MTGKNMLNFKIRQGVLVAPCMLSPGFQVERKQGPHWGYCFLSLLMRSNIDIISLACPESTFGGFCNGLKRGKHGIDYYESLDGYVEHCECLAKQTADMIFDMGLGGYRFICILGVEHSPTCAVSYMYSHKGMLKRSGIYYRLLRSELELRGLHIPEIGINRAYPQKALILLEQVLADAKREEDEV